MLKQNLKVLGHLWPAKESWELFSFRSSTGGGYKWHQGSFFSGCLFFTFSKVELDYSICFNWMPYFNYMEAAVCCLVHFMLFRSIPVFSENIGMTQSQAYVSWLTFLLQIQRLHNEKINTLLTGFLQHLAHVSLSHVNII